MSLDEIRARTEARLERIRERLPYAATYPEITHRVVDEDVPYLLDENAKLRAALDTVLAKVKELQDEVSGEPQEIGNALEQIIEEALR